MENLPPYAILFWPHSIWGERVNRNIISGENEKGNGTLAKALVPYYHPPPPQWNREVQMSMENCSSVPAAQIWSLTRAFAFRLHSPLVGKKRETEEKPHSFNFPFALLCRLLCHQITKLEIPLKFCSWK